MMRYKAVVTAEFEFLVDGDDPADTARDRNVDTAPQAAEVIRGAVARINAAVARFDNPAVTFSGEPLP
jgi:hypothetical protein